MTGYEDGYIEVSLPVCDKVGEVDTKDFLQVAAAAADREAVIFIVKADDESLLVLTIVIHCHFFAWADPEGKGRSSGVLIMGVRGTVGIHNLVEVQEINFDDGAIIKADNVGVIRGRVSFDVGADNGFNGAPLCGARVGLGHINPCSRREWFGRRTAMVAKQAGN